MVCILVVRDLSSSMIDDQLM